jgi:hypothetical protein
MSNESNYSFTTKVGPKSDLLTVRGDTSEEFKANLNALVADPTVIAAIELLGNAIQYDRPIAQAVTTVQQTFPQAQVVQQPVVQVAQAAQLASPHVCAHGPMKYIEKGPYGPFYGCSSTDVNSRCKSIKAKVS